MNFVAEQNIKRFRQMLEHETDREKRSVIRKLLLEEEAKLEQQIAERTGNSGQMG
jgi:hypothetical protein